MIVVSSYLGLKLYRKHRGIKISTPKFVVSIMVITAVLAAVQVYILLQNLSLAETGIYISIVDGILGILIAIHLVLITSYYEENSVDSTKLAILASLGTITVFSLVLLVFPNLPAEIQYFSFSFVLFFGYAIIVLQRSLTRLSSKMTDRQQEVISSIRIYLLAVLGDISIIYLITTIIFFGQTVTPGTTIYQINESIAILVPPVIFLLGNIFFYRGFVKPDNPVILQPQFQNKFILMTEQGLPVFEYDFTPENSIDATLISGALTAITAVLKEATHIGGDLQQVLIGDKNIRIEVREELIGVLFTDNPSVIQNQILDDLMNEIISLDELETHDIPKEQDSTLSNLVEVEFGLQ